MNYSKHYQTAHTEWMNQMSNCALRLNLDCDSTEFEYISDAFDEGQEVKLVWDGHEFLKIKWDFRCWWADCNCNFYYCVMLDLDEVELKDPFTLAKERLQ